MCVFVKIRFFYNFTITSQSKPKKIQLTITWDQEKLATKFLKVSCWALLFVDRRNFQNSFFVKNYYLNIFLSTAEVLSLTTEKISSKKMQATK